MAAVRPMVTCSHRGCPVLVRSGRCPAHTVDRREADRDYAQRRTDKEEQAFYNGAAWRRFRSRYAAGHPWCEQCERQGRLTPMRLVDHIVPIKEGGARLSESNVQSLCQGCQNRRHRAPNTPQG